MTWLYFLMFVLGGAFGVGFMALVSARKRKLLADVCEEYRNKAEASENRCKELQKIIEDTPKESIKYITEFRHDVVPIECSLEFDANDYKNIPGEWIMKEIVKKLSEGLTPFIEVVTIDEYYTFKKIIKGMIRVVKK